MISTISAEADFSYQIDIIYLVWKWELKFILKKSLN